MRLVTTPTLDTRAPAGGVTSCPGFKDRFTSELRALVPDEYELGVMQPRVG